MIVADTNVWSEPLRPEPYGPVSDWMTEVSDDLAITAVTIGELLNGVSHLSEGRRREKLAAGVERMIGFAGSRVLSYDQPSARAYVQVLGARQSMGRPISIEDAMIAGTCLAHGAPLATRNVRDFEGLGLHLINPWELRDRRP